MSVQATIIILLGLLVIGGVFLLSLRAHRQGLENLAALADRLGLKAERSKRMFGFDEHWLEGTWQRRRVRFWTYSTGSGKSRKQWVAVGVETPAGGDVKFQLCGQGLLTKISELFGTKEVLIGDPQFDAEWFITTNRPVEFVAALLPEIRGKLTAVRTAGARGDFERRDGWVKYAEMGTFSSPDRIARLEAVLPVLIDLADVADVCAACGPR